MHSFLVMPITTPWSPNSAIIFRTASIWPAYYMDHHIIVHEDKVHRSTSLYYLAAPSSAASRIEQPQPPTSDLFTLLSSIHRTIFQWKKNIRIIAHTLTLSHTYTHLTRFLSFRHLTYLQKNRPLSEWEAPAHSLKLLTSSAFPHHHYYARPVRPQARPGQCWSLWYGEEFSRMVQWWRLCRWLASRKDSNFCCRREVQSWKWSPFLHRQNENPDISILVYQNLERRKSPPI